jgi:NADH:ubiquinone oxidoreductase subunit C
VVEVVVVVTAAAVVVVAAAATAAAVVVVAAAAVAATTTKTKTCCLIKTCICYTMLNHNTDEHLNYVYNLSSYLTKNTLQIFLNDKPINGPWESSV